MMMGDDCDDVTDNDDDGDVIDAAKIRRPRLAVVERQGSPSPSSASPNFAAYRFCNSPTIPHGPLGL